MMLRDSSLCSLGMPTCWIIAGPNGAGKTTFAMDFLPHLANCPRFINADSIAAGLNPLTPGSERIAASRIFIKEVWSAIEKGKDFAFETTLAGRSNLRLIKELKESGWEGELIYLALLTVDLCKLRVSERVSHGGHSIPTAEIERCFGSSSLPSRDLANDLGLHQSCCC